jgi:serine/threonine-protein kinase
MAVLTVDTTMLYCPKCRSTYEEGTQRFCSNDGGRLLPAPSSENKTTPTPGVFTSILGKIPPNDSTEKIISSTPKLSVPKPFERIEQPVKPKVSLAEKMYQVELEKKPSFESLLDDDSILELEVEPPFIPFKAQSGVSPQIEKPSAVPLTDKIADSEKIEKPIEPVVPNKTELPKPLPKRINAHEIASGTAEVGNRKTNPIGRQALSWENQNALIGHTVKGRYFITRKIQEDADSLVYLAEDKIASGKKVVVRVFMDENTFDTEFADEIVSLSHINHPNIAAIFDSGELTEGNKFIVSEFVEGKSLTEMLKQSGQFNVKRTARVVRQISYALSEAHQNGILHRNLKPENIYLTISENGFEQVKLLNFGLFDGDWTEEDLHYKSPEEIEGETPTFASEIYSLAIIGYQMLTGKLPFSSLSEGELLRTQKSGLTVLLNDLRNDVPPLADKILEKGLAFEPTERYPKARDFGDAFFNALTTFAPWKNEKVEAETPSAEEKNAKKSEFFVVPPIKSKVHEEIPKPTEEFPISSDIHIASHNEVVGNDAGEYLTDKIAETKKRDERTWEKRSPELPRKSNWLWTILPILGAFLLLAGLFGIGKYIANRQENLQVSQTSETPAEIPATPQQENVLPTNTDTEMPPSKRSLSAPPNTIRFVNNKEKLSKNLAKNFLGFEIFYPKDWVRKDSDTNFIDVKKTSDGSLIEQFLITQYESVGLYSLDKEKFAKLAEKSNTQLSSPENLGKNYKVISQGETTIQDGRWKGYEVKFESSGIDKNGEKITIWGRRIWIPAQRASTQNGFVITMLATSLSGDVKSIEDVGTKGDLAAILETFEPEQN